MKPIAAAALLALSLTPFAAYADSEGKGHKNKNHGHAEQGDQGNSQHGERGFSNDERRAIGGYYEKNRYDEDEGEDGDEHHGRGRGHHDLPPGWEKKLNRGDRVPDDVWAVRAPLPPEIVLRLPPPPPGIINVRVNDRILRVVEKTHEVMDVLGLPHPPTPRR